MLETEIFKSLIQISFLGREIMRWIADFCCREKFPEARKALLKSISLFPCHWGAWKAYLLASGGSDAPIADPDLPRHWMREIYFSSLCIESRENEEGLGRLQVHSRLIMSLTAIFHMLIVLLDADQPTAMRLL